VLFFQNAKGTNLTLKNWYCMDLPPGDRHRIGEAVEQELTRLLADRGVPQSPERGGEIANIDGGAFEVAPDRGHRLLVHRWQRLCMGVWGDE